MVLCVNIDVTLYGSFLCGGPCSQGKPGALISSGAGPGRSKIRMSWCLYFKLRHKRAEFPGNMGQALSRFTGLCGIFSD